MILGFTGTRNGMSETQKQSVERILDRFLPTEAHHGDCIGADSEFHDMCVLRDIRIIVHPPDDKRHRAFVTNYAEKTRRLPTAPYLERNRNIVDACDMLIACPKSEQEELRSGTWATIRYARKTGKNVFVVNP